MDSITNLRYIIMHCIGSLGGNVIIINKKLREEVLYPAKTDNGQQVETANTESKEYHMAVALLSGLNHNMYGQLMNDLHNGFRVG